MNKAYINTYVAKLLSVAFTLLCLHLPVEASILTDFKNWLSIPCESRGNIQLQKFASKPVSQTDIEQCLLLLKEDWNNENAKRFSDIWKSKVIKRDSLSMKFEYRVYGEKPVDGYSLYISLHGGGGTSTEANEQQWKNQIMLYQPKEGIYVAPRSLENRWDMWLMPYLDGFLEDLIQSAVATMEVNPNKVYLTGYSAGGDGTYRMAPRMADRWAAALMCAGHPGNTSPLSLRNLPFGMWVGMYDFAYQRHIHGLKWTAMLKNLHEYDSEGYIHNTRMIPTGHWMDRQDTVAFHWMAQFRRNPYPQKVVWKQDSAYVNKSLYWLAVPKQKIKPEKLIVAEHYGNNFLLHQCYSDEIHISLNDSMIDYQRPVIIYYKGKVIFKQKIKRTIAQLYESFQRTKDSSLCFSSIIKLKINDSQ